VNGRKGVEEGGAHGSVRCDMSQPLRPTTFYHGTSIKAALSIQKDGFDPELSGSNAGALLGKGVYCTTTLEQALHYAKRNPANGVVLELEVDVEGVAA